MNQPKPSLPRPETARIYRFGLRTVMELFDVGPGVAVTALTVATLVLLAALAYFIRSAPPTTITITTGPEGSTSQRNADKYAKILAKEGIKVSVIASKGSYENLQRLMDPNSPADVGFVQGGVTQDGVEDLISLGSISYQPLMVFYRGKPVELLSDLKGKKIAIGPVGSGVRVVALALLALNGIKEGDNSAQLLDTAAEDASKALLEKQIDAAFVMGESTPMPILRALLRSDEVHLYSFKQAAAYTRKIDYLNKLDFPMGTIDPGLNIPARDVELVGPQVELIAVKDLHPALSDLLLEAAVQTHGKAGIFQKRGEFPSPQEHAIRISDDAQRFYKSGKSLLYRYLPFWLASLVARFLVAFVPTLVVLIPVLRAIPAFFRWRARIRIRRHYRELLALERSYEEEKDTTRQEALRREFDRIEEKVNRDKIRPAFADQFYGLRGHINYVRDLVNKKPV